MPEYPHSGVALCVIHGDTGAAHAEDSRPRCHLSETSMPRSRYVVRIASHSLNKTPVRPLAPGCIDVMTPSTGEAAVWLCRCASSNTLAKCRSVEAISGFAHVSDFIAFPEALPVLLPHDPKRELAASDSFPCEVEDVFSSPLALSAVDSASPRDTNSDTLRLRFSCVAARNSSRTAARHCSPAFSRSDKVRQDPGAPSVSLSLSASVCLSSLSSSPSDFTSSLLPSSRAAETDSCTASISMVTLLDTPPPLGPTAAPPAGVRVPDVVRPRGWSALCASAASSPCRTTRSRSKNDSATAGCPALRWTRPSSCRVVAKSRCIVSSYKNVRMRNASS
eukprot:m.1107814 g.1107814  ORF g.1107814 m.1107814 type:complete len:335 (-) comp24350_c0_seq25:4153-5157(-)